MAEPTDHPCCGTVGRAALARKLAHESGIGVRRSQQLVGALLDEIAGALADGEDVRLRGFGTLSPRHRSGRTVRDPRDGTEVDVQPRTTACFRAAPGVRDRLTESLCAATQLHSPPSEEP